MKSITKKLGAIALAGCMAISVIGCGSGDEDDGPTVYYDNEENPLLLATTEVDGVFNPFFSSSATDSNVVGMTQLGMMTSDEKGELAYGPDEDTLVLDYEAVLDLGANGNNVDLNNDTRTTTFYFVLKNNVKFSDGKPVTIKDVLFNLYVYLDMSYTGSSTIYSTDIVGLQEYRTQESDKNEQESFMSKYQNRAQNRIDALITAWENLGYDRENPNKKPDDDLTEQDVKDAFQALVDGGNAANANLVKDLESTTKLYKKELEDAWSMSLNSYSDMVFKDKNNKIYKNLFTTDVEVFLYNQGKITWNNNYDGKNNGRLESSYVNNAQPDAIKALKDWKKDYAINRIYEGDVPDYLGDILQYSTTKYNLLEQLANEELEKESETMEKTYKNISGIKFANGGVINDKQVGDSSVVVNEKTYTTPTYNSDGSVKEGNEVLSIKINGVDPKAKWNFAFTVAPMHYYSSPELISKFDYVENFGVRWNSQTFMNNVVKNPDKIGVPVGAGPYMASNIESATTGIKASDFRSAGIIYYVRNPYYVNVSGHEPAIKKVRYVVVASNQMTTDLYSKRVDYSEPNAKQDTEMELSKRKKSIGYKTAKTNGYGYIGINAGKVPYLNVRRAIMYSINTKLCIDYYKSKAEQLWRSMSSASEYYPKDATAYYPYIGGAIPSDLEVVDPAYKKFVTEKGKKAGQTFSEKEQIEFITRLMENPYSLDPQSYPDNDKYSFQKASYKGEDVYEKTGSKTHWCSYTFTVAGEVDDHPAWSALYNAGNFLKKCGFDITVKTDANALQKLNSGALAVWAAAWSSTIDPDMYQVYHKDSKAGSVQNWGYPSILRNDGGVYDTELGILNDLSRYIEEGRQHELAADRKPHYYDALDEVMKLAVELPTYQRKDLYAYNKKKIDEKTLSNPTAYRSPISELYNVSLIVKTEEA